jgi:hypothetical protein
MKKTIILLSAGTLLSLAATAASTLPVPDGDPKKEKDKTSGFKLSDGYFNLFSIFLSEPEKADSTKLIQPASPARLPQNASVRRSS